MEKFVARLEGFVIDEEVEAVDSLLKRLWDDLVEEGKAAQNQLHNITAAIMAELRQDASEASDFEQLLRENGEEVAEPDEG